MENMGVGWGYVASMGARRLVPVCGCGAGSRQRETSRGAGTVGGARLQRHLRCKRRLAGARRALKDDRQQVGARGGLQLMEQGGARLLERGQPAAVVDDTVGDHLVELVIGAAEGGL